MPKKVPMFVYFHPEDEALAREKYAKLFSDPLYTVQPDATCARGRIFVSSLDLEEDDATWGDYGSLSLED